MEYIFVKRQSDQNTIADYKTIFKKESLEEIVEIYNSQVRCGITGVHQQALYLIALKQEFKERMNESPIYLIEYVLGLVGKIEIVNGQIKIVD